MWSAARKRPFLVYRVRCASNGRQKRTQRAKIIKNILSWAIGPIWLVGRSTAQCACTGTTDCTRGHASPCDVPTAGHVARARWGCARTGSPSWDTCRCVVGWRQPPRIAHVAPSTPSTLGLGAPWMHATCPGPRRGPGRGRNGRPNP